MEPDELEALAASTVDEAEPVEGGQYFITWKDTASYREPGGNPVGLLRAGRNGFYGQKNFSEARVTDGEYTSTWWAQTNDHSGNRQVWVNTIYFKGGENDQPVEGLRQL
ncbi:hypothetical protein ACWD6P_36245 [Streptomyces sp. NPDC002446]